MSSQYQEGVNEPLETAAELAQAGIITRGCAYRLAKLGIIPSYGTGPKMTGVRFRRSEVLAALRRPIGKELVHDRA